MWNTRLNQALFLMGLLVFITDSAILRPYRRYASLQVPEDLPEDADFEEERKPWRHGGSTDYYRSPQISGKFRPNPRRCCQVGERVAQKSMSCDITVLAMLRKYHNRLWLSSQLNRPGSSSRTSSRSREWPGYKYNYQSRLSEKVAKCSAAQPRKFVSCCKVEHTLVTRLKRCQQAAVSRVERRRCRAAFNRMK